MNLTGRICPFIVRGCTGSKYFRRAAYLGPTPMETINFKRLTFLIFLSYAAVVHAGGNTTASTLFVYKPDGTIQCDKFQGVALDSMKRELTSADIKVFSMRKGYDGREGIALCSAPTGQINVYEIASSDVSEALRLGFKQLPANRIREDQ